MKEDIQTTVFFHLEYPVEGASVPYTWYKKGIIKGLDPSLEKVKLTPCF
jgi:hypothetical protein